ncbi:DUF2339 domain-containing protein [Mucilaginibacter sp. McL0603]|uniref:DUF2339 domain-containing protein n=1 Tax=Mucilaginibacter sp. McL0603 TaxID=3415670 RepID=UPI003CE85A74
MDALYIILFIVIIILLISNQNSSNKKIGELEFLIVNLQNLVKKLSEVRPPAEPPKPTIIEETRPVITPEVKKAPEIARPVPSPEPKKPETVEYHREVITDPLAELRRSQIKTSYTETTKPEPELSFFEKHPDLEKFIGENLVNKIGIAILVLAIGFFVKYAIDNNWVGPAGRVGIGILCGGILIGIAHRLRSSYKAFSSVLVGGGLAVFYFTITLAYHQFHLFNQTTSFIILIIITCFAVVLSLLYDKQELAVIALIGGFSSPFMVSNGNANYNALFIYLVILNAGLLIIAYNKSWRILNTTSFGLTVLVLAGIIYTLPAGAYLISFIYITILYLLFFFINIANNIRENKKFITSDFTILLSNAGLYFGTGLYLLTMMHAEQYRGLFSASIGGINLLFSFILFRSKKAEINILYLLIGITLTFISLTAPIQLHGHFITLFWSAECVLLYWLSQKSGIKFIQWASLMVWVAMLTSLTMDWFNLYGSSYLTLTIIVNKGFITTIFSAICSWLLYSLAVRSDKEGNLISPDIYKYLAIIMLFASGFLEINHQFLNRYPGTALNTLYLMLYFSVFVYVFCQIAARVSVIKLSWQIIAAKLASVVVIYLLISPQFFELQYSMLVQHKIESAHFIAHWIGTVFILLILYRLIIICKTNLQEYIKPVSWALSAAIVIFFSLEVSLMSNLMFYSKGNSIDHIETVYVKTGLPVLWGLSSFALMWFGMRYKTRVLRIISLTLFSITLIKLFVFDIENIPAAGKIAAFFCLGVLLLIISFMYQKVKKIVADDEDKSKS